MTTLEIFRAFSAVRYGSLTIGPNQTVEFASLTAERREELLDGWMLDDDGQYIEDRRRKHKLRLLQICLVESDGAGKRFVFADADGRFTDEIPGELKNLDSGIANRIADAILTHIRMSASDQATLEKK